jgi:hypothetical protein
MGANRTSFLANRRLQPLGHLSGSHRIIPELPNGESRCVFFACQAHTNSRKSRRILGPGGLPTHEASIAVSVVRRVNY